MGIILKITSFVAVWMFTCLAQEVLKEDLKQEELKIQQHPVEGSLFEIAEQDMLEMIEERLKKAQETGKLETFEKEVQERIKKSARTPKSLNLPITKSERTVLVDPSIVIREDIKDHKGIYLAKAGTRLNPLDHIKLSKGLLFIDGDNPKQVDFALKHKESFNIVLTGGSPIALEEQHREKFFFDQNGLICKKYGITHSPAKIEQSGNQLQVTEFVLETVE